MHSFLNLIVLLGALQGFILAILLFTLKKNSRLSNNLLAFLILSIACPCVNLYLVESGLYGKYEAVAILVESLPLVVAMAIGPLLYLYCQSIADPTFRITPRQRLHFIPIVIDLVPPLTVWCFLIAVVFRIPRPNGGVGLGVFIDEYNTYADIPRWLSVTLYTALSWKSLNRYKITARKNGTPDYRWLRSLLLVFMTFQALWLMFLVPYIMPSLRYRLLDLVDWYPLYIPMVVMIYWIGFKGYLLASGAPRRTSRFSDDVVTATITKLEGAMNLDRAFLDPELSVERLAAKVGIAPKTVSGVLNQHMKTGFSEFVNTYRVEEVKLRLLESSNSHLTLAGVALECGFSSQATFQRAFKQATGFSPSEFVAHHTGSKITA